jgi:DNA-binding helix-hairpin-helix protein with protein kinase domain
MTLRQILSGTSRWLRPSRCEESGRCEPLLDDDGLLADDVEPDNDFEDAEPAEPPDEPEVVSAIAPVDRRESLQRLHEGFEQLVDQLQQINQHLGRQAAQHEELMSRVEKLPLLLETLPAAMENQKNATTGLLEELRNAAARDWQFSQAVERMPAETARQTDTLLTINHQLEAAADVDVQMVQSFNKFRTTLDRLNHNTVNNTEGILQMSRTFAASDRYLKYVIAGLNRRYAWTLALALSVCLGVVAALVGVIIYLTR